MIDFMQPTDTKRCPRCRQTKERIGFARNARNKDGLQGYCKDCMRETVRERSARPEVRSQKNEYMRRYSVRPDARNLRRNRRYRSIYGISLEDYRKLVAEQGYACPICNDRLDPDAYGLSRPVVDHCHKTGRIRGILCTRCNTFLGKFGDDLTGLQRVVAYLSSYAETGVSG